jgi:hypothetical protein
VLVKAGPANHVKDAGQVVEADATVDGRAASPELQVRGDRDDRQAAGLLRTQFIVGVDATDRRAQFDLLVI